MAGLSVSAFWFSPKCKLFPSPTGGLAGFPADMNRGTCPLPLAGPLPKNSIWLAFESFIIPLAKPKTYILYFACFCFIRRPSVPFLYWLKKYILFIFKPVMPLTYDPERI